MTAQSSEILILDGKKVPMAFCPPLPPDPSLLYPTTCEIIEEHETPMSTRIRCFESWVDAAGVRHRDEASVLTYSTACWREYQATWELKEGLFYFVSIYGRFRPSFNKPILADWFTGVLRIKHGNELCYVHMGFGSVTEFETHIAIEAGCEMGRRTIDKRGKEYDWTKLGWQNLPGRENFFPGDSEI